MGKKGHFFDFFGIYQNVCFHKNLCEKANEIILAVFALNMYVSVLIKQLSINSENFTQSYG